MGETQYQTVGQPITRTDAKEKVMGRTIYGVDLVLPRMLYGKALLSPYPHARIVNVDTRAARHLPGVKAIVTGQELPYTYGSTIKDRPILARDIVRFAGEPVVAVAAVDLDTVEDALSLIQVEYEELPPLLDPEIAMEAGSPLVHPELMSYSHSYAARPIVNTNICSHFKLRHGDIEAGFALAHDIIEETYTTQMVEQMCMEPHMAIAQADPVSGRYTLWVNTAAPYISRTELAQALEIPMKDIRIIVPPVGGSFGAKMYLKVEPIAVVLAQKTGNRPVKVVMTRAEELTTMVVKGPTKTTLKSGLTKEGKIIARQVTTIWDTGAYADCGPRISRNGGHTSAGPYYIPHISIDGYCVYTNKNIGGAFRGYGVQEVSWAYERHMETIAHQLGIDPLEFRLRNILQEGDENQTGQKVHSVGLKECLEKAAAAIEWGKPSPKSGENGSIRRGKGIACIHKATGAPSSSSAIVRVNEDGTVGLLMSTIEQGQGSNTILAQMVAEELGVPTNAVAVSQPDTDYTPFDSSTTSSRSTFHMGNAIRLACADILEQLKRITAETFQVTMEEVESKNGKAWVREKPDQVLNLKQAIGKYFGARGGTLIGRASYRPDVIAMDQDAQSPKAVPYYMYAAQAAEVEVDIETGKVKVLRLSAAHDVGQAINPVTCLQQIEGALGMGLGGALTEEVKVDAGITRNPNFHDYKIPTALDMPLFIPMIVEVPHRDGPYGAKGVGEPGLAPTAPAIANAVYDAVGVAYNDLPLNPERVLRGIKKQV
ncbi:xanthine dehydrogenase family protein molybdopterin-binding subunit [Candidatus Formimonas warabiya]|uniref:Aldehyde oxidase/xanthine dehydrogenase a/b hammerhead domain-containing protein n=1 Tax=Formimonas warabiya TaxID=1761012 RepID=A0A3G1KXM4_FORW1|nr:xanthine dehydrogenase family protein molybdopterin-binding subunit [Candidatus Formimonas warabiya]ATW27147.1 hypothetical protein DCMF_22505 [Candidatus Formimonas warabiya]